MMDEEDHWVGGREADVFSCKKAKIFHLSSQTSKFFAHCVWFWVFSSLNNEKSRLNVNENMKKQNLKQQQRHNFYIQSEDLFL